MPQLHQAPFEHPQVVSNLAKFIPDAQNEVYVAYYDSTNFLNKDMGLLLTQKRLILFKKKNILQTCELKDISEVAYTEKNDEAADLVVHQGSQVIEQSFSYREELHGFLTRLSDLLSINITVPPSKKDTHIETFRGRLLDRAFTDYLYSNVPIAPGEEYLAYLGDKPTFGLTLTTHRLVATKDSFYLWSTFLNRIERIEVRSGDLIVVERGKVYSLKVGDNSMAHAMKHLAENMLRKIRSAS